MKARLIVAGIGIPLLLVVLLWCPPVVTAIAIAALSAIGANELLYTTGILTHKRMVGYAMVAAALVPVWSYFGCPMLPFAAGAFVLGMLLFVEALAAYPDVKFNGVTAAFFAAIVIPVCLSGVLRIMMQGNGRFLVVIPIMMPFISDSGGYFGGWFFGKHKLAPVLSPKKTVEGAVGSVVTTMLAMVIYGLVVQFAFGKNFNYLYGLVYGLIAAPVSMIGDLSFSMVKREMGIKDYGKLFGAHGGVLDRFDSVIFATPLTELLLLILPVL